MRSLTERRWLVMSRKIWVLCYTPHERRTCDRFFCKKVKNRNSYLRSIFEEKNMNISYLYLPHLPGRGEQCNGEHDRQPLYPRTSTTLVTENLLFCQKCGNIYQTSCQATFGVFLVVLLFISLEYGVLFLGFEFGHQSPGL